MSTTIDSRVVEMRFDNKNFEKNVADTMSTVDKLQQKLKFTGATKGLEGIDNAAKKVDMSGLSGAVDTVRSKFSALEVMGVTALMNLTNSAVNAGKRMVSALTIEPIMSGFSEYETKIGSIQTIMSNTASKGTTMEDVTRVIGELNTYADKTIYNFAEMTRNIGTFTAAGVGLEESASAIQGIANLAAASGSTSQQASTAMYQLSQALAAGSVKLMDWNSVVNAGMGGEKFQEALKATARDHGVAVDALIKKNGSFRESLQEGWITADILNETLNKFTVDGAKNYAKSMMESGKWTQEQADALIAEAQNMEDAATKVKTFTQLWDTLKESAQSGWSQTWEILVGDFEEAKETLTKVSDVIGGIIGKSADARNNLLQGWKDAGGRDDLIASFSNIFDSLVSIATPIKEAFREIFPPTTVEQLKGFTEAIKNFTEKLTLSDTASKNLKRTFAGLFAIVDIVKQVFGALFKAIKPVFGATDDLGGGILGLTAKIGDAIVKFNNFIKSSGALNKIAKGIATAIEIAYKAISKFVSFIKNKIIFPGFEVFHSILERIHKRMSQVGEAAGEMKGGVSKAIDMMNSSLENSKFLQMMEAIWTGMKTIGSGIAKAFGALTKGISEKIGNADFSGIFDLINTLSLSGIAVFVAKFVKGFSDITESVGSFKESVIGILDEVKGCFEAYQTQLKAGALLKIASAIAILAASILVISLIDSDKLSASLGAITVLFANLLGSMAIFEKMGGQYKGIVKATTAMIGISVAVLILASALKKIGDLNIKQVGTGLLGIAGLMGIVVGAAKLLSSGGKKITKGATQMILFAAAVKILASVCTDLSSLSWTELGKGLVGVGVLMGAVSLFLNNTKLSGKAITTATGVVILGAAMKVLASACTDFGQMKWGEIGKGLASIGALLAEVAVFTKLTGSAKHVMSTGIALIAIGAAMKIFASATKDMSGMSWTELAKGLSGMAGALLAVTLALKFMPKNMVGMGVGLIGVSTALVILASALGKMGGMSWESIAKGLLALCGSIMMLAIALNAMTGTLGGSAALLVAASAILIFTPALAMLGAMSWESIVKGLVAIGGAFAILGVAGVLLGPMVPAILGLSAALALLGVGVLAVGAGVLALGVGIGVLATSLAAGTTAIVAGIAAIIMGIVNLIPEICVALGEGLIRLCGVIAEAAPAICEAFVAIILSLADALRQCVPVVADTILYLAASVLASLVEYTPQIVDSLFKFLIGVLDGIAANLPALIKSAINVIMAFFAGVADALSGIDVGVLLKGIVGIGILSAIMLALSAVAALVPGALVGVLGMGAVIAELALVLAAVGAISKIPGLEWLISEGGNFLQTVGTAIGQFFGGMVGGFMGGVSSQFPQIGSDLSGFMTNAQPFIEGAKSIDSSAMDGVRSLVETILLLTAANILDGLTSWLTGGSSIVTFGEELAAFGPHFAKYAESVRGIDGSAVESSANAALAIAKMADNLPNQGGVAGWFAGENSLAAFAEEMAIFGPKLKAYADSVTGLDPNVVINSANAATSLAKMAENLPNQGGVAGWFAGENSLAKFAEELAVFGPSLKAYSDSVAGLDPNIVNVSANAAATLGKMAENLPNQGGMVSWFTGDNTLSVFGAELVKFGPYLKSYSDSVAGISSEAVVSSASAALLLSKMAATLPNQGGMVSWFTGDNTLSVFGAELAKFGPYMKAYANNVVGIDADAVVASANAAAAIGDMAKHLPNQGGMVAWFTGDNTLSDFGAELAEFGPYMGKYAKSVKGIDVEAVSASTKAAKALANMSSNPPSTDSASKFTKFASSLVSFGEQLKAYSAKIAGIDTVALVTSVNNVNRLIDMSHNINGAFPDAIAKFGESLSKLGEAGINKFIQSFKDSYEKVVTVGETMMTKLIDGIKKKSSFVAKEFTTVASDAVTAMRLKYTTFYKTGEYLVSGFASGISANTYKATAKAAAMASAAAEAAREELDVNSPSVVFKEIGGYVVDGLAEGIDKNTSAEDAITKKAQNIKTAFQKAYDGIDIKNDRLDSYIELGVINSEDGYIEKHARQQERIRLAEAKYANLKSVLGEEDLETQKAYNEYLDERVKLLNLEKKHAEDIKAAHEETLSLQEKELDDRFQNSKKWIDNQKKAGDFSLIDELYAWKRVQSAYEEGTDQRIEADEKILDLEKQIDDANNQYFNNVTERTKELADAQDQLKKQYEDAVESRKNAIVDSHGLFDEVAQQDEVKGSTLMDNLMGQLEHNMTWSSNMNELSSRGILSDELIAKLREMGPSAAAEISAMANMTDKELKRYNQVWEMNNTVAEEQAKYELTDLEAELKAENDKLIEEYNLDLETLRTDWLESIGLMTEDTTTEFTKLVDESINIVGDKEKWSEAGAETVNGILKGVTENEGLLHKAMSTLANSILNTFNNALGIESPSKKFAEAGKFMDQGLIVGIGKYAKNVYTKVTEMGSNSIDSLTSVFSGISNVLGGDLDLQPVISPVVDLSNARASAAAISNMLGGDISVGASSNIRAISSMMRSRDITGRNEDIVSAIDKLHEDMGKFGNNTYNINGVTYDDGTNISEAVETLVRAARVERRR